MMVFPTRVGMNRMIIIALTAAKGVPHPRGDEPTPTS